MSYCPSEIKGRVWANGTAATQHWEEKHKVVERRIEESFPVNIQPWFKSI